MSRGLACRRRGTDHRLLPLGHDFLDFPSFSLVFPVLFVPTKSQEPVVSLLDQTTAESSWHHWT